MSLKKMFSLALVALFFAGTTVNFAQDGKDKKEVKKECSSEVKKNCASQNSCCGDKGEPTVGEKKDNVKKTDKKTEVKKTEKK
ncbi:MAG TPA: hypothetical protein PL041_11600 [Melioribacteraceae bacterium]|nr:hypothetical protein [Melioribacteraceae bacterium]